jgi:membrane protein DedA with SNARE-associated domain
MDFFTGEDLRHLLVTYGYLAIFLIVTLEAMGIPLPGETMLLLASVYAGTTHHLGIGLVIVSAAGGAILGDNLGYLAGQYGGSRLLQRYGRYIRLDEHRLRQGHYLFERHGGKVVFFGRFLPILRMGAAFLAGAHRMRWPRFLIFNATGGVVWATTIGLAGFIFGNSLLRSGGVVTIVSALLALLVMALVAVTVHRGERRLQEQGERDRRGRHVA